MSIFVLPKHAMPFGTSQNAPNAPSERGKSLHATQHPIGPARRAPSAGKWSSKSEHATPAVMTESASLA